MKVIYKVYSIFDCKIGSYLSPFFMRSKGEAIRAFTSEIERTDSNIHRYPADFTLFEIGEYNDDTAELVSCSPLSIGVALEFVNKES